MRGRERDRFRHNEWGKIKRERNSVCLGEREEERGRECKRKREGERVREIERGSVRHRV
jgi:hypothetical protein